MLNLQERTECAILGTQDLEPLYKFETFPVFMGCTEEDPKTDVFAPMDWWISKQSGLIQLKQMIPLDVLYAKSHGSGCVGDLWRQHHEAFAHFIHQFKPNGVIEIGGGHGLLSKAYHQAFTAVSWTIIEPNPSPADGVTATYIKGFFDETFVFQESYEVIVHSHVLEHIYSPHIFLEHIANFAQSGKLHVFSIPNIQRMIERKYTNGINFEHTLCLTEPYVEYLLAQNGFRICAKEYFKDDHSIFYATVRDLQVKPLSLSGQLYASNRQLYLDYVSYHEALVADLNQKSATHKGPVYLFGAHVFAQYILGFGLDTSRIVGLLDNDPNKQGRRLYGSSLKVYSTRVLSEHPNPVVILKAGVYNDEIKQDILGNVNANTLFWE